MNSEQIYDIKKDIKKALDQIDHNFINFAKDFLRDAIQKLDSVQVKESNILKEEQYNAIKIIIVEKYGLEGFNAFCLGHYLFTNGDDNELESIIKKRTIN